MAGHADRSRLPLLFATGLVAKTLLGKAEIKKGSVTKPGFDPDGIAETEAATVRERSNDQNGRCLERSGLRVASRPSRRPRQMPIPRAITIHATAITANNVATISKARPMNFAPGVGASGRAMMRRDGKGSKKTRRREPAGSPLIVRAPGLVRTMLKDQGNWCPWRFK
jgi:hypothetical protein